MEDTEQSTQNNLSWINETCRNEHEVLGNIKMNALWYFILFHVLHKNAHSEVLLVSD